MERMPGLESPRRSLYDRRVTAYALLATLVMSTAALASSRRLTPRASRRARPGWWTRRWPVNHRDCADRRVTFRLRAPNAKDVAVTMQGKRLVMQKDDQAYGAYLRRHGAGLYTYSFSVDGTTMGDPSIANSKSLGVARRICRRARSRSVAAVAGVPKGPSPARVSFRRRRG